MEQNTGNNTGNNTGRNLKKVKEIRYPFSRQLIFALVMENEELCKELLERIFEGRHIKELKILNKGSLKTEATIIIGANAKSIRMDVLFEDATSWYDIELQVENEGDIPKRSRYYSAVLDVKNLKRGDKYNSLRPSYIIFICQFDYFNQGEAVYVFERADLKKSLPMGDESYTIVVNTKSEKEVPESLRSLFDYINKGEVDTSDSFISQIHEEVMALQESEEVANIMTMEEEYERRNTAAFDRGREEGMAAGLEQGMAAAIKKLALSMKKNGITMTMIAEMTGLSVVEIEAL